MPISSETIRDIPSKPLDSITALEAIREIKVVVEDINDSVKLNNIAASNDVTVYSADGALATSGVALCTSGVGQLSLTLGVPTVGARVEVIFEVNGGGDLVITGSDGAVIDDATTWIVVENTGAVLT